MNKLQKGITSALLATMTITGVGMTSASAVELEDDVLGDGFAIVVPDSQLKKERVFSPSHTDEDKKALQKWDEEYEAGYKVGNVEGNNNLYHPGEREKSYFDNMFEGKSEAYKAGFTLAWLDRRYGVKHYIERLRQQS